MHGYALYYCRGELNDEHKRMFMITNAFSYVQGTNKTTKCKKESYDESNCIFPLLNCLLSQYLSNTWCGIWHDHHLEMRCLNCACFCHFLSPNVKKCSQDHCSYLIKNNLGHYFHSFERFLQKNTNAGEMASSFYYSFLFVAFSFFVIYLYFRIHRMFAKKI